MPSPTDDWTWEEKAEALNNLSQVVIRMRNIGDWYAKCENADLIAGAMRGNSYANGTTPEEAVENLFTILTTLEWADRKHDYVVLHALTPKMRQHFVWVGNHWKRLPLPEGFPGAV